MSATGLAWFNTLPPHEAERELLACCASPAWAAEVAAARPYADLDALLQRAGTAWRAAPPAEWERAFAAHPRIGERAAGWSASEQAGVATAEVATRRELEAGNRAYEARFGRVFLICAAGRDVAGMLAELRARLANDPDTELRTAAEEQREITRLRLRRLLDEHA